MPAIAAAPLFWGAIAGSGIAAGASLVGAKMQSGAAHDAANIQSKAATDALAFQREQQAQQQAQFEQTQHSNYDQWAADEQNQFGVGLAASHNTYNQFKARDQRVGQLGELLGMAPRVTPDLEDPTLTIPPYQGNAGSMTDLKAGTNLRDPNYITQQLQGVYKSLGTSPTGPGTGPTDIGYMAGKVAATGGWTPQNASYWPTRIAQEIAQAKAKGTYHGTAADMLGAH